MRWGLACVFVVGARPATHFADATEGDTVQDRDVDAAAGPRAVAHGLRLLAVGEAFAVRAHVAAHRRFGRANDAPGTRASAFDRHLGEPFEAAERDASGGQIRVNVESAGLRDHAVISVAARARGPHYRGAV